MKTEMPSSLEIAQRAELRPILDIAEEIGLEPDEVELIWHGLEPPYRDLFAWVEGRGPKPESGNPAPFRPPMLSHPLEDEDFGKVSRVIANRLEIDMRLQFDSTVNYALGRSTLDVSIEDTQIDSPYNTYVEYGLPPGPICNPGHQALEAALNPTPGDWLYFVTVSEGDTRFTADPEEHEQNVQDFNEAQRNRSEQEGNG